METPDIINLILGLISLALGATANIRINSSKAGDLKQSGSNNRQAGGDMSN